MATHPRSPHALPTASPLALAAAAAMIMALAFIAHAPVLQNGFINCDDPLYITNNAQLQAGFSASTVAWCLTNVERANVWHPVTWLSHLLDLELHGLAPRGHHATNLMLHMLNAALVLIALFGMTRCFWRSAAIGALFAVHPINVEVVAWVSLRKDLLCALFWFLSLIAYTRYTQTPQRASSVRLWYTLTLFGFTLAVMSKPMAVTLPLVLLLLDAWPLNRVRGGATLGRLLLEKLPFFCIAIAAGGAAWYSQSEGGAVMALDRLPIGYRVANAALQYGQYLRQLLWPMGFAIYYPHPERSISIPLACFAALIIAAITIITLRVAKRLPAIAVGWFWFLGVVFPVIGLFQMSAFARCDRYMYIPAVGLFIAIIWLADHATSWSHSRRTRALGATALLVALGLLAARSNARTREWKSTDTVFNSALDVTGSNWFAHNNLALMHYDAGRYLDAVSEFKLALMDNDRTVGGYYNLGMAMAAAGDTEGAIAAYKTEIQLDPNSARSYNNLASLYLHQKRPQEAIDALRRAVEVNPELSEAHINLGIQLLRAGQTMEGEALLNKALVLAPESEAAHFHLARLCVGRRQYADAIRHFDALIRVAASPPISVLIDQARLLGAAPDPELREPARAIQYARQACELTGWRSPPALDVLAIATAGHGQFSEASQLSARAVTLARQMDRTDWVQDLESRRTLFEQKTPYFLPNSETPDAY